MNEQSMQIIEFPVRPRMCIRAMVEACPALTAVAARLPPPTDAFYAASERLLAELFQRLLHPPQLRPEEAAEVLDHEASPERFTEEELVRLAGDPETRCIYDHWKDVWENETDPVLRMRAGYYAALLSRLYRMEYIVLCEAGRA